MKNTLYFSAIFMLGAVFALATNATAGDMPAAAEACATCHNENGVSDDPEVPTIAGASDFFLENQLAIYAEEARPCEAGYFEEKAAETDLSAEDHCAIAKGLSDDEVFELAGYFSSKPFVAADQEIDDALADKGASIHAGNCKSCHTEGGGLALDDAGILAGQWKPYLMEQFEYYKADKRWQPEKMQPEMEKLGEEDMKALAEFYAREGLKKSD